MSQNRFDLEQLEHRTFLSASVLSSQFVQHAITSSVTSVAPTPVSPGPVSSPILLGSGHGAFNELATPTPVDESYKLTGKGEVSPLGKVKITGNVLVNNIIGLADPSVPVGSAGTLVLHNHKGSVTIELTGPINTVSAAAGTSGALIYNYTVVSGTKAYKNYKSSGQISLVLTQVSTSSASVSGLESGVFSISFRKSGIVPV